jgi:carbon-monoxide dehydrogenase small subunit
MKRTIACNVNGRVVESEVEVRVHLADFLRRELRLTGTHLGCEHGACGACTVMVDGEAVRSCLILAIQADGRSILTVEGLAAADGTLSLLQQAFRRRHALQCGFCTSGMLMTLHQFLEERGDATEAEIRDAISGNLCRCTGYDGIVTAAMDVVAARQAVRAGR